MEAIRTSRDEKGIVTVTMDLPGKPVNTCSPLMLAELGQIVAELEHEMRQKAGRRSRQTLWKGNGL